MALIPITAVGFLISTRYFDVEHAPKWGRLGDQDDYFWQTPTEKKAHEKVQSTQKSTDSTPVQQSPYVTPFSFVDSNNYWDNLCGIVDSKEKQTADQQSSKQKNKKETDLNTEFKFDR